MAKPALQTKNILTLVLSPVLSACSAMAIRRLDAGKTSGYWYVLGAIATLSLQIWTVVRWESKEEEEFSLSRKGRMQSQEQDQLLSNSLVNAMQKALDEGRLEDFNKLESKRKEYRG